MTSLLVSPKSLHQFYETAKLGGLERGLGIAFLRQIAGSLLRNGKFRGCGAGLVGTKQVTCLLFSPMSLGHFYEGEAGAGFRHLSPQVARSPKKPMKL